MLKWTDVHNKQSIHALGGDANLGKHIMFCVPYAQTIITIEVDNTGKIEHAYVNGFPADLGFMVDWINDHPSRIDLVEARTVE